MRNLIPSILGLATVMLFLAAILFLANPLTLTNNNEKSNIEPVTASSELPDTEESTELTDTEESEPVADTDIIPIVDESSELPIAENYDEILSSGEEMEYRQEIADEVSSSLPQEYINPNALAGREHILTEADFDCYDDYFDWYIANQDRPFDIDGYFTDVPDYEPIIDPNTNVIVVEGIAFDHEGTVLSKEEAEQIEVETEGEYNE